MTLPKQLQDQAAQLERMMQQIKEGNTPTAVEAPEEVKPDVAPLEVENVQPNVTPEIETPPAEASIDWEDRARKAEQRYQVLQGKYNKEVLEARNNQGQSAEVEALKNQIDQLRQQLSESQNVEKTFLTGEKAEELREGYGSELIDDFSTIIRDEIMAEINEKFQNVQRDVKHDSFATKQALLAQKLAAHRIDFEQTNNDPLFHDWLSKFDPETGIQRQQALTQLFNQGQLDATASMFMEFVQGGQPQQQTSPFTQHVQHPTSAPAADVVSSVVPTYSRQQIQQFYTDWARGKYTAEEAERIEREIINSPR